MKNYSDIIKLANHMHKERELHDQIAHESPDTDVNRFEQSFNDVFVKGTGFTEISFDNGEPKIKHLRTDQVYIDHGHTIHDF